MRRGGRRHCITVDVGEVDPGLFKNATVTQHAAASTAARFALPGIFLEFTAVCGGQFLANRVL